MLTLTDDYNIDNINMSFVLSNIYNNIDNYRIINFLSIADNVIIKSIKLDNNFIENVEEYLQLYYGKDEIYITLVCNTVIINSEFLFNVNENFIMPDNTDIITVIKCYKKNLYLSVDAYYWRRNIYDEYAVLLSTIIDNNLISKENIIKSTYRELITLLNDKLYIVFKYLTDEIKDDYDIVLKVVTNHPLAFKYASERLKDNYKIATIAIDAEPLTIKYASYRIKDNYNIVLRTVKRFGSTLKYVSDRLKDHEDIVLAAITSNCHSITLNPVELLIHASIRLANNSEIIKIAIANKNNILTEITIFNDDL